MRIYFFNVRCIYLFDTFIIYNLSFYTGLSLYGSRYSWLKRTVFPDVYQIVKAEIMCHKVELSESRN